METVLVELPSSSPSLDTESASSPPARTTYASTRTPTGQFVKGQSGNPAGRAVGSHNRASLVKAFIEEKLTDKLDKEALALMQKAINMAKAGDRVMLKLLLGDMMAATRSPQNEKNSGPVMVNVQIKNYTDQKSEPAPTITVTPIEVS